MSEEFEKMYGVAELAAVFSVCHRTIRRWLRSGRLRGTKIGRRWRVKRGEVLRVLGAGDE